MEVPQFKYNRKLFKFDDFKKFEIFTQCSKQQYCNIYNARLKALKNHILQKIKIKWGKYFIKVIFIIGLGYIYIVIFFNS